LPAISVKALTLCGRLRHENLKGPVISGPVFDQLKKTPRRSPVSRSYFVSRLYFGAENLMEFKDMKSVADLIANKEALIKRNKRGKITAAAVAAAGASVIAAAQAEAGSVDGFEDITSSVVSFERLGNGQIEFELENGQRFIASEGQYIIDGEEIMVSSELVTVVNGPGMNTMVVAVAVAGAAALVGLLLLTSSSSATTATSTTSTASSSSSSSSASSSLKTVSISSSDSGDIVGSGADTVFHVSNVTALTDIDSIDGGTGTDSLSIESALTNSSSLDVTSLGLELHNLESVEVTVNSDGGGVTIDMDSEDTTLVIDANTDNETIAVTDLGAKYGSTDTAALTAKGLADGQTLDVALTGAPVVKFELGLENTGDSGTATVDLDNGVDPTQVTIMTSGSTDNDITLTANAMTDLTVKGSADLEITNTLGAANLAAVTDINAATATGDLELSVDATVQTVDLGTGNDTLNVTETMTANHAYDGGDGTDVLALASGINAATGAVDKFETISTAGTSTIDFDIFDSSVSTVDVNAAATVNLNDLDVDNLLVTAVNNAVLDFDGTAGAGVNNVRITQEGAGVTIDGAASIGAATVSQTNAGTNTITVLGGITELEIDGSRTAVVAGAGAAALTDIDASGAAALTMTANAPTALATFEGSAGVDNISVTLASGATLDGGAGNDAIDINGVTAGTATVIGGAGIDSFDLTTSANNITLDLESLSDMATLTTAEFNALSNVTAIDGTNAEQITAFDTTTDTIQMKDLTDVDIVTDLAAYTVSEFVDFKTEILASFNAGNDIVIAEFNGTHFVAVDVEQNLPGAVGTIGLFELDAAIAAADIV
jgi:hypothetical protein